MFANAPKRHPLQSFPFWFLILSGIAAVAAWKLEFFTAEDFAPAPESTTAEVEESPAVAQLTLEENWVSAEAWATPDQADAGRDVDSGSPPVQAAFEWAQAEPEMGTDQPRLATTGEESGGTATSINLASFTGNSPSAELESAKTAELVQDQVAPSANLSDVSPKLETQLQQVDRLLADGDDVNAHRILSGLYWQHPDLRPSLQARLDNAARKIYLQPEPHYFAPHLVQAGETLQEIARQYQVPWQYLANLNRVDPGRIQAGQSLKVIQGPFHVIVERSRFTLTVHCYGYYVAKFPIGIGADGRTPAGSFSITDKVQDPTYYGPHGVIEHDDPLNPLGEHWLAINNPAGTLQGIGIHGTIEPQSIGQAASQGCLRLHNRDVAELYDLLSIGSEVIIRD